MRKLGVSLAYLEDMAVEEQLELIKKIGFEAVLIPSTYPDKRLACQKAAEHGMVVDQIHARFSGINSIWLDEEQGEEVLADIQKDMDVAKEFGVKQVVVHLDSGFNSPFVSDIGKERLDRLMAYSAETGVGIAFENIRKLANLAYVMERYPEAGYCYDNGHECCYTDNRYDFMSLFGKRLLCTHIHDNSGYPNDDHLIPYDGVIDFQKIVSGIKKSGYQGILTSESHIKVASNEKRAALYGKMSYEEWYTQLFAAMDRLRKEIDE